ncbi:MAG: NUDIX hydrolase [Hyphomicrobium sp.]
METFRQVAALPYFDGPDGRRVCLISSRFSKRWVIPKGWPRSAVPDRDMAEREARQEAGVAGEIGLNPIGHYTYIKRLHLLSWVQCTVDVYPLHVDRQFAKWREKSSRRLIWETPDAAARKVREPELAALIGRLALIVPYSG